MILLLTLLAPLSAHADPEMLECSSPYVMFTSPSNGQTNVPVDVVPAIGLSNDSCRVPASYTLTVLAGDTSIASSERPFDIEGDRVVSLPMERTLEPNTEYRLVIEDEGGGSEITEITFVTGTGQVSGLDGVPSISLVEATMNEANIVTATYAISPAADPDELSIVHVSHSGAATAVESHRVDEENTWTRSWILDRSKKDLCLTVSQRDGLDVRSSASPETCLALEKTSATGCSVSGLPVPGWMLPLTALVFARRRTR